METVYRKPPEQERSLRRGRFAEYGAVLLASAFLQTGCGTETHGHDSGNAVEQYEDGEELIEGIRLVESKTDKPLTEGEKNILRSVVKNIPEKFLKHIRSVSIEDFEEENASVKGTCGDYGDISINRKYRDKNGQEIFLDFSNVATLLQYVLVHEVGHRADDVLQDGKENYPFADLESEDWRAEEYANEFMRFYLQTDTVRIMAYSPFDWDERSTESSSVKKLRVAYEWMRDKIFDGKEPEPFDVNVASAGLIDRIRTNILRSNLDEPSLNPVFTGSVERRTWPAVPPEDCDGVHAFLTEKLQTGSESPLTPLMKYTRAISELSKIGALSDDGKRDAQTLEAHQRIIDENLSELGRDSVYGNFLLYTIAEHYRMAGEPNKAVAVYEEIASKFRDVEWQAHAWDRAAIAYEEAGRFEEARRVYEQMMQEFAGTSWAASAQEDIDHLTSEGK